MQPNLNRENELDCLIVLCGKHEESIALVPFSKQGRAPALRSQRSERLPATGGS